MYRYLLSQSQAQVNGEDWVRKGIWCKTILPKPICKLVFFFFLCVTFLIFFHIKFWLGAGTPKESGVWLKNPKIFLERTKANVKKAKSIPWKEPKKLTDTIISKLLKIKNLAFLEGQHVQYSLSLLCSLTFAYSLLHGFSTTDNFNITGAHLIGMYGTKS